MALSLRNRRILALTAFIGLALLAALVERRVLVPFALDRPPADEVAYWERHVERNAENAASQLRLGVAYAKAGQLEDAELAFTAAMELKPDYDGAAIGRYGVVVRKGEEERALAELADYARVHPDCAVCWQNLAAEYLRLRDLRAAEAAVKALLASDFSVESKMYNIEDMEVEALILAGRVSGAQGDHPRAIAFFRDAIERDPSEVRAYILQAKNLLASDDPKTALAILDQAAPLAEGNDRLEREIDRLKRRAGQDRR